MTGTITVVRACGGQGATTIAAALAVFSAGYRPTTLVSADRVLHRERLPKRHALITIAPPSIRRRQGLGLLLEQENVTYRERALARFRAQNLDASFTVGIPFAQQGPPRVSWIQRAG